MLVGGGGGKSCLEPKPRGEVLAHSLLSLLCIPCVQQISRRVVSNYAHSPREKQLNRSEEVHSRATALLSHNPEAKGARLNSSYRAGASSGSSVQ